MHYLDELLSYAAVDSLRELMRDLKTGRGMAVEFWVVDTKCKVLPESSLPQDGSEHYYARSVVPAASSAQAVDKLVEVLGENHIEVESIDRVIRFRDGGWSEDDEFEVCESFAQSERSGEIELGCFISEKSHWKREPPNQPSINNLSLRRRPRLRLREIAISLDPRHTAEIQLGTRRAGFRFPVAT